MFSPDFIGGTQFSEVQPAAQLTTTTTTAAVNFGSNLTGKVLLLTDIGTLGGTSPTVSCQLQTSATSGGSYTNFGSAFGTATGFTQQNIDLEALPNPFVKVVITIGGTSPTVPIAILAVTPKKLT